MADGTGIAWTDATWNPLRGCTRVSPGCVHCYAEGVAARFSGPGQPNEGLAEWVTRPGGQREGRWTGKVALVEHLLDQPLRWQRPRRIFVNSMSDLFHEAAPDEWIDQVFAVMALAPQHIFQVLTKRPERMRAYLGGGRAGPKWPWPHVWLGVSAEDQARADERIPILLDTPAAVRWLSAEPLLGPIDLTRINLGEKITKGYGPKRIEWNALTRWEHQFPADSTPDCDQLKARVHVSCSAPSRLSWVVIGGESGRGARPMDLAWARSLVEQCQAARVPVFVKQDSGQRSGQQGRFTDAEWALKEFPHA